MNRSVVRIGLAAVLVLTMVVCVGAASADTVTVTFNAGEGSGSMSSQTVDAGVWTTLNKVSFTAPTNKEFIGWSDNAWDATGNKWPDNTKFYTDQQAVNINGNLNLYAVWSEVREWNGSGITDAGYYKLKDSKALTSGITVTGAPVVIDLNGHVLSRLSTVETDFSVITVTSGGNLTVTDSNPGVVNYLRGLMKDINGGVITGGSATMGGGVYVDKGGNFTLKKGTIAGNSASYSGGGVFVKGDTSGTSGTFTMNGGTISWNCASPEVGGDRSTIAYGGGVYVYMGGTFTMNGGTISENKASIWGSVTTSAGGGVYNYGTFTMNGGSITGNKAIESLNAYGGGVYNYGTFEMTGGTISNNTSNGSHSYGGGVCNNGTFEMTGGSITGNSADAMDAISEGGGVYENGTFKVSGTPKIIDNTAHGYPDNVYLYSVYSADKLILDGDLTGDADIRISYVMSKQIATGQQFGVVAESVGENALSSAAHFRNDAETLKGTVSGTGAERKLVWTTTTTLDNALAIPFTSDGGNKTADVNTIDSILQKVTTKESSNVSWLVFEPHECIEDLPVTIDGRDVIIAGDSFKMILGNEEAKTESPTDNNTSGSPLSSQQYLDKEDVEPAAGIPATLSGKLNANLVKGQPGKLRLAQKTDADGQTTDADGWKLLPVDNGKIEGGWYTFTANFTSTVNGGYMFVLVPEVKIPVNDGTAKFTNRDGELPHAQKIGSGITVSTVNLQEISGLNPDNPVTLTYKGSDENYRRGLNEHPPGGISSQTVISVFDIDAKVNGNATMVFELSVNGNPNNIRFIHGTKNSDGTVTWDSGYLRSDVVKNKSGKYKYTVTTGSFSPFAIVYAVPAASSGSSVTTFRGSSASSDGTIVFDRSTVITELKVAGATGAKLTPTSEKGENGWYGFDLSVENAPNGGDIFYQVPLDVIDIKGFTEQDVCLYHKENGTWTALPTYLVKKDARYAYYKSVTKSFSPFYIGFEEGSAQTEAVEVIDPSVEADPIQIDPVTPILPQPTKSPAPIAAVIAGLGAVAVFFRTRRQ